jgi:hypothetical protein
MPNSAIDVDMREVVEREIANVARVSEGPPSLEKLRELASGVVEPYAGAWDEEW